MITSVSVGTSATEVLAAPSTRPYQLAATFVGRWLGMMAVVVPLSVVTPAAITGGSTPAVTYRLLTEGSDNLATETGDLLRSEQDG